MTVVTCPRCHFRFDTSYGRIMACGGCPSATWGDCGYARCPKCKYEFKITGVETSASPFSGRRVA